MESGKRECTRDENLEPNTESLSLRWHILYIPYYPSVLLLLKIVFLLGFIIQIYGVSVYVYIVNKFNFMLETVTVYANLN